MHLDESDARPQAGNIGPIRREIVFEPLPDPTGPVEPAPAESPLPAEPAQPTEPAPASS